MEELYRLFSLSPDGIKLKLLFVLLIIVQLNLRKATDIMKSHTLSEWAEKNKIFLQPGKLLRQITELLNKIHLRGDVHGNLTPCHVILDSDGENVTSIQPTTYINQESIQVLQHEWRPAEEKNSSPSQKGDIFSLGCMFMFILSNGYQHPFGKCGQRSLFIANHLYDLSGCAAGIYKLQNLIRRMISHNYRNRPSCVDVMSHPFVWTSTEIENYLNKVADNFDFGTDQYKSWTRKILFSSDNISSSLANYNSTSLSVAEIFMHIKVSKITT